ncbi:uncharacterized protein LOC18448720 isoform X2 [Amborella trichopoda]|uniref:uncharacterized protein LOC18448720 isoform X2 n=1 Tax=Amborella trichopoda TaxID=13333 RepID=UPI0009BD78B8|nr:uncharacterized protein LOC18448720 isoform X2 [Amborella trichopoda]|eukprot:XP_020531972.1 uncharacterized protein LOC18448720 isoform X2 [Amborella trichopoda]
MESGSSPPSPGVAPVTLSHCISELVRFILSLHLEETQEFDLGLTKDYCFSLLKEQEPVTLHPPHHCLDGDTFAGVPPYPLYNQLASAIDQCISSNSVEEISESIWKWGDEALISKKNEWQKLIMYEGSQLVKMLQGVNYELHVQEPFYSLLRVGRKTIEGRCAIGNYKQISSGDMLLINKCLILEVQDVKWYSSFYDMMEAEGLEKVLPGVKTLDEGVGIYRRFYTQEKEKCQGVLGICVSRPSAQPYISMANIISAKGNLLTVGARALAKHVSRCGKGWWGRLNRNDSHKNALALEVIFHITTHACWMNIHIVKPHGAVFEIRVTEGYGARWSGDGSRFIGFLEPHMDDGHSVGNTRNSQLFSLRETLSLYPDVEQSDCKFSANHHDCNPLSLV